MRRALVLGLAASLLSACELLSGEFRVTGTVHIAPALSDRAPKVNAALFLVATNEGGVPVAVHRIVNPEFPAYFEMDHHDLLVPALRRHEELTLRAEMNTHGSLGSPRPGDLQGSAPGKIRSGSHAVRVLIDRVR